MIHVMTLSWNGLDKLKKLKDGLFANLKDHEFQWTIKDNGSMDGTVKEISTWGNVNVIPWKNNLQNFSEGMNTIFHEVKPKSDDFVLLLNNDVMFPEETSLNSMMSCWKPNVGAVGARLLYSGTNQLQHAGVVIHSQTRTPTHFRCKEVADKDSEKNRYFQIVTGAVYLTKAELYENAFININGTKGMDESFRWAFDDVDLSLNILYHLKKKIVYCGKTTIYHEESASLKKNPVNRLHMNHNLKLFHSKWKNTIEVDEAKYSNPSYNLVK